jgi:phosphoribosylamine---glycine ligase
MAAEGYPMNPKKGAVIRGLPKEAEDAVVFHAGTQMTYGATMVSGGRVLCVTALAETVKSAQHRAYEVLSGIRFDGMQYRKDIGYRAIKH